MGHCNAVSDSVAPDLFLFTNWLSFSINQTIAVASEPIHGYRESYRLDEFRMGNLSFDTVLPPHGPSNGWLCVFRREKARKKPLMTLMS